MDNKFKLLSWNIKFARQEPFKESYYSDVQNQTDDNSDYSKNLSEIALYLQSLNSIDFFLLQNIDRGSKRSYFVDQSRFIAIGFPEWFDCFACNHLIPYIPLPGFKFIECIDSGILNISRPHPIQSERIGYSKLNYYPKRWFSAKQCFMTSRYPTTDHQEMVIINSHHFVTSISQNKLTADFDFLRNYIINEYKLGNYVIAALNSELSEAKLNILQSCFTNLPLGVNLLNQQAVINYSSGCKKDKSHKNHVTVLYTDNLQTEILHLDDTSTIKHANRPIGITFTRK